MMGKFILVAGFVFTVAAYAIIVGFIGFVFAGAASWALTNASPETAVALMLDDFHIAVTRTGSVCLGLGALIGTFKFIDSTRHEMAAAARHKAHEEKMARVAKIWMR